VIARRFFYAQIRLARCLRSKRENNQHDHNR
jgi:hypothetical protein